MISLNKLVPEDIDKKIRLNQDAGVDIFKLQELIKEEYKDFKWMKIRAEVQCQSYQEQLEHIAKRIAEGRIYREPGPEEGPSVTKKDVDIPEEKIKVLPEIELPVEKKEE